jgi:hypothetical protein
LGEPDRQLVALDRHNSHAEGLPITLVGIFSTPTLAAATGMRRWRLTSAATADSAAEQRSVGRAYWRGDAAVLRGWTFGILFDKFRPPIGIMERLRPIGSSPFR